MKPLSFIPFFDKIRALLRRLLLQRERIELRIPEEPAAPPAEPEPVITVVEEIPPPAVVEKIKRKYRPRTTSNLKREQAINWILEFMTRGKPARLGCDLPISYFDGAESLIKIEELGTDDGTMICVNYPPTHFERFDSVAISQLTGEENEVLEGISMFRVRKASMRHMRGRGVTFGSQAVELTFGVVDDNFEYSSVRNFYTWNGKQFDEGVGCWNLVQAATGVTSRYKMNLGYCNMRSHHGGKSGSRLGNPRIAYGAVNWVDLKKSSQGNAKNANVMEKTFGPEWSTKIQLGIGLYAVQREYWRVMLGFDGFARMAFRTDPVGVREVFRLREIPEGKSRRAALRHWVTEHWRRQAPAEENAKALIHVREHLRGAMQFRWNNLGCEIRPSEVDRLKNLETVQPPELAEISDGIYPLT